MVFATLKPYYYRMQCAQDYTLSNAVFYFCYYYYYFKLEAVLDGTIVFVLHNGDNHEQINRSKLLFIISKFHSPSDMVFVRM